MTDTQLDTLIDCMKPDIKIALKAILNGESVHIFDFAQGTNTETGMKTKIQLFMANELAGAILEGTTQGIDKMAKIFMSTIASTQKYMINIKDRH